MKFSDFRIGWRLLLADKMYALVVLGGLSAAMAAALLLGSYIWNSIRVEAVPDGDHVMRIEFDFHGAGHDGQWTSFTPVPFKDRVDKLSGITGNTRYYPRDLALRAGDTLIRRRIGFVDSDFRSMFDIRALRGNVAAAIADPDTLALCESTARELFGQTDVVGKTLAINGRTYRVTAIIADRPVYANLAFDALAGTNSTAWDNRDFAMKTWGHFGGNEFVRLVNRDISSMVIAGLKGALDQTVWSTYIPKASWVEGHVADIRLIPFNELGVRGADAVNNVTQLLALSLVAVAVLILSAINYVNLSTVRTLKRQRELGIRKVLGATVARVRNQFLVESTVAAMISTVAGVLWAWMLTPWFTRLMNMPAGAVLTMQTIGAACVTGLLIGLVAGIWPARVGATVVVAEALAGRDRHESNAGRWLRRGLTIFQLTTTLILVSFAMVVMLQLNYVSNINPGFEAHGLRVIDLPDGLAFDRRSAFADAVSRLPGIDAVSLAVNLPGKNSTVNTGAYAGGHQLAGIEFREESVDTHFFGTLNVTPLAGRVFNPIRDQDGKGDGVVINRTAALALGFTNPDTAIGQTVKRMDDNHQFYVLGVIDDLRHDSAHTIRRPALYLLSTYWLQEVIVRSRLQDNVVREKIASLWRKWFPDSIMQSDNAEFALANAYSNDRSMAGLLAAAAILAALIAAGGLYALAAYNAERHARQMVLRKLFGASGKQLLRSFMREPVTLLTIGVICGLPLAWLAQGKYLSFFQDVCLMGSWPSLMAMIACVFMTLLATMRHCLHTMQLRAGDALRM